MGRHRLAVAAAVVAGALVVVPSALAASLLVDGSFEKPRTASLQVFPAGSSLLTCTSGALGCWLVNHGEMDLVPTSVWLPARGKQSIELNGGSRAASVEQAVAANAGATYKITFSMAGNPAWQGGTPMTLRVVWEDIDQHGNTLGAVTQTFTFDTTGKTPTSMGWTKHSFKVTTVPDTVQGRLFFQSLTDVGNSDLGPAVDKAAVALVG
jgi:hypothetical protein